MLPMKRPYEPQEFPESPEQPRKKARLMPIETAINIKDHHGRTAMVSRVKLADDAPIKLVKATPVSVVSAKAKERKPRKHKSVPHIDLAQMQCLKRKASLDILPVKEPASGAQTTTQK